MRKSNLDLPKDKWYTKLLNIIVIKTNKREYLYLKDFYCFQRVIVDLDKSIKLLLPILQDVENVHKKDHKKVSEIINELFTSDQWNDEFLTIRNVIVNHYNKFL